MKYQHFSDGWSTAGCKHIWLKGENTYPNKTFTVKIEVFSITVDDVKNSHFFLWAFYGSPHLMTLLTGWTVTLLELKMYGC